MARCPNCLPIYIVLSQHPQFTKQTETITELLLSIPPTNPHKELKFVLFDRIESFYSEWDKDMGDQTCHELISHWRIIIITSISENNVLIAYGIYGEQQLYTNS